MNTTTNQTATTSRRIVPPVDPDAIPDGHVRLERGHIVRFDGVLHVVGGQNAQGARLVSMFNRHGYVQLTGPATRAERLLMQADPKWVEDFLNGQAAVGEDILKQCGPINTKPQQQETDSMARKAKTNGRARGGLAASALSRKAKEGAGDGEPTTKGKLGQLFGFSLVSVIRRLGKEGLNWRQVKTALTAKAKDDKSISVPADATMKIQINREGEPAALSKEQVAELVDLAGPAEPEPKAEKKTRKSKKDTKSTEAETATATAA